MSILIKGMEMPKDGVYWCEIGVADDIAMITIHGEERKSFPLVPVKQHGRLIDADALIAWLDEWYDADLEIGHVINILGDKIVTPTILEAEEGE